MNDTPPRLRFSLRTLLLVITAVCVWLAIQVGAAYRQRDAVAAVLKAGGTVMFDYQAVPIRGKPTFYFDVDPQALPPGPAWLRQLVGDDFFRSAFRVTLDNKVISESDFARLGTLPKLRFLSLTNTKIALGDAQIQRPIGDAELAVLGRSKELRFLDLENADLHASGLAFLASLELDRLMLFTSNIDDTGMEQIGKIKTLEFLTLPGNPISDAGLEQLQNLTQLISLDVSKCNVTDSGLRYLTKLTKLTQLRLRATGVSSEGIRELQKSLPTTTILGP